MKGIFKKTFVLFLACALFMMGGAFNAASANWGDDYHVTYSYDSSAPAGLAVPVDTRDYDDDDDVTLKSPPTTPPGYSFLGWQKDGTGTVYQPGSKYTHDHHNLHFIGKWSLIKYTVAYQFTGTIPSGANLPTDSAKYTVKDTVTLKMPDTVANYQFNGWTYNGSAVTSPFQMVAANVTFWGSWSQLFTLTYSFDNTPEGANLPGPETRAALSSLPLAPPTGNVVGFTFEGWKYNGVLVDGNFVMPNGPATVTGAWKAIEAPPTATPTDIPTPTPPPPSPTPSPIIYSAVSYSYTGIVPPGAPVAPATVRYGWGSVKVAPSPEMNGYIFTGWVTTDVTVKNGAFIVNGDDIHFTGSWVKGSSLVPNTGGAPMFVIPAALALISIAVLGFSLKRKIGKNEK